MMGNASTVLIAFATSYILFHYLPMAEVGMWFVVLSIVGVCEAARNGLLGTTTVTFYAGAEKERGARVLGAVWFLALILSGIVVAANVVGLILLPFTHNALTILCVKWVGITYLSTMSIDVATWRLQAEERYKRIFQLRLVNSIATIGAFAVLIVVRRMTLENALLFNMLTNWVVSIIALWKYAGIRHITRRTKQTVFEVFHYGKYMLGTTSFTALLNNADTWVINVMLGPEAVAIYNLATRFLSVIDLPIRSLSTTGMSEMAIAYNRNDMPHITYIFKKYTGMLTVLFIPVVIVCILIADIPINILGGVKYMNSEAANAFRLFLVASLLFPLDRFNGLALDVLRQTKINFYKVIIMLAVRIAMNFLGIAIFGSVYGVNFSTFVVVVSAVIYGNYQLKRCINYRLFEIVTVGYHELKAIIQRKVRVFRLESTAD